MIPLVSGKAYVYDYGRMYTFAHMCGNSLNTGDFYQGRIQPLAEGGGLKRGAPTLCRGAYSWIWPTTFRRPITPIAIVI